MDESKQKILEALGGIPEEVYDELVGDFMAQLVGQLDEITQALSESDIDRVGRLAHSVKGVAANLRIHAIEAPAKALEALARNAGPVSEMKVQQEQIRAARAQIAG